MAENYVQVNTNLTIEDVQKVDFMMRKDALDNRSAFLRRIIRQEWNRRHEDGDELPVSVETGKEV